jgi:hypothetical protein
LWIFAEEQYGLGGGVDEAAGVRVRHLGQGEPGPLPGRGRNLHSPGASKQPGPDESPPPQVHEAGLRLAPSQGDGIGSGTHVECSIHTDMLLDNPAGRRRLGGSLRELPWQGLHQETWSCASGTLRWREDLRKL